MAQKDTVKVDAGHNHVTTNKWSHCGDGAESMFDGKYVYVRFDLANDYGKSKGGKGKMTKLAGSTWSKEIAGGVQGSFWFGIDKDSTPVDDTVAKLLGNLSPEQQKALKAALKVK